MFIEFATAYARYFLNKQLGRYFNKFKISKAAELSPIGFYDPTLSFPWMLAKDRYYQIFIPSSFIDQPASIYLDEAAVKKVEKNQYHLIFDREPKTDFKHVYTLQNKKSNLKYHLGSRKLSIEGTCNFRDMGGYQNTQRQHLKWGRLYRADHLSKLGNLGRSQLADLTIKTVVDFRSFNEVAKNPDILQSTTQHVHIPIEQGKEENFIKKTLLSGNANLLQGTNIMKEIYSFFVTEAADKYRQFFKLLEKEENYPLVFHCTAGKDRTGFAAALLLSILDMPRETIMHDYMLSNYYRHQENHKYAEIGSFFMKREIVDQFLIVRPVYLYHALQLIEHQFGSAKKYLEKYLGIDESCQENIKMRLLSPV